MRKQLSCETDVDPNNALPVNENGECNDGSGVSASGSGCTIPKSIPSISNLGAYAAT